MRYDILLAPEAVADLKRLKPYLRSQVRDALGEHLRHQPGKKSRSRIKRLRGMSRPQFRLRVDDVRIFFDIVGDEVHVLAIVTKSDSAGVLAEFGEQK